MYGFDKTRLDLAREFKANPFGEHRPDLQYLLHIMRKPNPGRPHFVLLPREWGETGTLALVEPGGRTPPRPTSPVVTDLAEAEWHVFKLRWAELAGEELPFD